MRETRLALRRLRRRPVRTAATALTLAVGIGTATAAFSAVDGVLLRDLPVRDEDDLVVAWHVDPARGSIHIPFTVGAWEAVEGGVSSLSSVAAVQSAGTRPGIVDGAGGTWVLDQVMVAGDFFGVMGARPALGRLLRPSDDVPGAPSVLVLSHRIWVSRFDGDRGVLGTTLRLGDRSWTVVGVAPRGFDIPRGADAWLTLRGAYPGWAEEQPCCIELDVVGRLAPGATPDAVARDLTRAVREVPDSVTSYRDLQPVVTSLRDHVVGSARPVLRLVFAAAVLLLAAALANTTLLLLTGGSGAAHELAVRRALGAREGAVVGRLLADAGLVGAFGTGGGIVIAWLALRGLLPLAPVELPGLEAIGLDRWSLVFALLAGLGSTAVAGVAAGLATARGDMRVLLASGGRGQGPAGSRWRKAIAGLQVGFTVVTAVGAGLLVRSLTALDRLDPGFEPAGLHVVTLKTPYTWFEVPASYPVAIETVARDLEGRAGILAVRPTLTPPLESGLEAVLRAEGQSDEEAAGNPYVVVDAVMPGHFRALGIPLVRGRPLVPADDGAGTDPVVVVSESTARALWPGEDPVGRRMSGFPPNDGTWWTVIGVVADTRYRDFLEPRPTAYYPLRRMGGAPISRLLVRTSPRGPASVRTLVEDAFAAADPRVAVLDETPMADILRRPAARQRFAAGVLLFFAGGTVVLAVLGVYGVFTVQVEERTREMGVRRALGARRGAIAGLVLVGTLRVALPATVAGLVVALAGTRLVASLVYGVRATDPPTFAAVGAISLLTALGAALIPALRASGTDPAICLRAE